MTKTIKEKCAVCGTENEFPSVEYGPIEEYLMDSRAVRSGTDHLPYVMHTCRGCGYSNYNLSSFDDVDRKLVTRDWLSGVETVGDVGKGFQIYAEACKASGRRFQSGTAYLAAAWLFDDSGDREHSDEMRGKAVEQLLQDGGKVSRMIAADLLRILGRFEEAEAQLALVRSDPLAISQEPVLAFEAKLISEKNTERRMPVQKIEDPGYRQTHRMTLDHDPFLKVMLGSKRCEVRLLDDKRSRVKVNDVIIFTEKGTDDTISVTVTQIRRYPDFKALYKDIDPKVLGYRPGEKADPSDMDRYYTRAEQEKYDAVAFMIKAPR